MPSWDAITDDAALSAIPATPLALAAPEHPPAILMAIATGAFAEPVACNAILRATPANQPDAAVYLTATGVTA